MKPFSYVKACYFHVELVGVDVLRTNFVLFSWFCGDEYLRFWFELNDRVCSGSINSLRYSADVIGSRMHRGRGDSGLWLMSFDVFGSEDSDVF